MSFDSWLQNLRSALAPRWGQRQHRRRGSLRAQTRRLNVETLEDRLTPSLYWGGLSAQSPPNVVLAQPAPLFADFTGDGIPDRLTSDWGVVAVRPGRGDGTFGNPIYSYVPTNGSYLAVDDFNGDGRLDLVTFAGGGAAWDFDPYPVLLLGRGDGTFYFEQTVPPGMINASWWGIGDFNGDGRPDGASGTY